MRLLTNNVVQVFMKQTINDRDALMNDSGIIHVWCSEREMGSGFVRHMVDLRKTLALTSVET